MMLDIRQRTGWLFTGVVLAQLVLISAQVTTRTGVTMLEVAVFGTVDEVKLLASGFMQSDYYSWHQYVAHQEVRQENADLKAKMAELEIQLQQERALAQETRTVKDLLDLQAQTPLVTIAATVIAGAASPDFR